MKKDEENLQTIFKIERMKKKCETTHMVLHFSLQMTQAFPFQYEYINSD